MVCDIARYTSWQPLAYHKQASSDVEGNISLTSLLAEQDHNLPVQ